MLKNLYGHFAIKIGMGCPLLIARISNDLIMLDISKTDNSLPLFMYAETMKLISIMFQANLASQPNKG